jgi:hypothetical protein
VGCGGRCVCFSGRIRCVCLSPDPPRFALAWLVQTQACAAGQRLIEAAVEVEVEAAVAVERSRLKLRQRLKLRLQLRPDWPGWGSLPRSAGDRTLDCGWSLNLAWVPAAPWRSHFFPAIGGLAIEDWEVTLAGSNTARFWTGVVTSATSHRLLIAGFLNFLATLKLLPPSPPAGISWDRLFFCVGRWTCHQRGFVWTPAWPD